MEKLSLIKIKNPFNRIDRDMQIVDYIPQQTLLDIRNSHFPKDIDVVVSVNGKIIPKDELAVTYPVKGDQILFVPEIQGGGDDDGKSILRAVLMLVVVVIAAIVAPPLAAAIGIAGTVGTHLMSAMLIMIGGLIVNTLLPPPKPQLPDTSNVYSWSPHTTQQQGLVVPKFYGINKLYGNIIATHIENIKNKKRPDNYINILIDLGLGPVKRLYDFMINDQPSGNYKGVTIETRYGYIDQPVISNFNDTKTEYPLSVKVVKDSPYTYVTVGNNFNGLEVEITFPQGIFYALDDGGYALYSVNMKIEIRKQGEENWRAITSQPTSYTIIKEHRWSAGRWIYDASLEDSYWVEYIAGDTNPDSHYEGEKIYIGSPHYVTAYWSWIYSPTEVAMQDTVDYETITGKKSSPIIKTFRADNLDPGKYEIRISNLTEDRGSRYGDDMYLTAVREIYYDDFEYPRHVLVGIKALSNDQLSGSLRFSCMSDGALIRTYDGSKWSVTNSNNPAWVCWDILTQPVFDNDLNVIRYDGIEPSRLDLVKFKEWADFCDELVPDGKGGQEKRITFNGGFDSETTMWEAALKVCEVGRAILVWNGVNLTVAVDKPSTPVQLFTVGNISIDSFKETFLPMDDRASEIEIDFINSEKEYQRDKLTVINTAINSSVNKVNLQLFGITKPSEAWRAGMYRLANNQYITRTIEFDADIDSIACTIGDVINIQHDIPQWGYGGRIVSATTNTITLDRKITINTTKSYIVMIRLSNDSIVERFIVNPSQNGEYDTFTVSSAFPTIPEKYNIYTFGEVNKAVKPFRIISISRNQEQKATIVAIEYNANIYNIDNEQPAIAIPDYSSIDVLPSVYNIRLEERLIKGKDGTINDVIDIYYTRPNNLNFAHVEIWYNDGSGWIFSGISLTDFYRLNNVEAFTSYTIALVTVNLIGQSQSIQNAPKATIYTLGKIAPPSNVTDFTAKQNGQLIDFNWSHIPDVDLWGYEIRMGLNWETARVIATAISQNHYIWQAELNGTYRFLIKAIDESGIYSTTPASVDITIRGINEKLNIILSQDEMTKTNPANGTKINLVYIDQYHALMLPHTLSDTDVPTWTDTTSDIVNYKGDINIIAEYITNAIDTFKDTDKWLRIQETIVAIDASITDKSYPDRTDITYPEDTDTHVTIPVDYSIWYQISDDNITYSDWIQYAGTVQENFRYIKIKFLTKLSSQTSILKLYNLLLVFDVPEVTQTITDLAISATTGTDIVFSNYGLTLYATPIVKPFIKNATGNRAPSVSNVTATGCHIDIFDATNTKVAGTVDLEITGY